ncbi:MAG: hypothetical protein KAR42_16790 [candidate division Zixibacteria bacterium]|nr:hypothetical protein [candidate division Zixibacteria bacterium]
MPKPRINDLKVLRVKLATHLSQYVERMKIFMAEEKLAGSSIQEIRKVREDPLSSWSKERNALKNEIKRSVAGFINKIHSIAYQEDL